MSEHSVDPAWRKLSEFRDRFDALMVPDGQGHYRVKPGAVAELAAIDPESVVVLCRYHAGLARQGGPEARGHTPAAAILASAYQMAFGDDSLTIWLDDLFTEVTTAPLTDSSDG